MPSPDISFYGSASASPTTEDILAFSKRKSDEERSIDSIKRSLFQLPGNDSKRPSKKSNKNFFYSATGGGSGAGSKSPTKRSERASCIRCAVIWTVVAVVAALLIGVIVMYVIIPVVFYSSSTMRRRLMFVGWSRSVPDTLGDPAALGLTCGINRPTASENGLIGTWYVPAYNKTMSSTTCKSLSASLKESPTSPLVFLIPTFEQHRATPERVALLKKVSSTFSYHVITFDYIGMADSADGVPRFDTVVADATKVLQHFLGITEVTRYKRPIILWGDTWGAPVALELAKGQTLSGQTYLILQSPVQSTAAAAARALPFNKLWRGMPLFDKLFVESLIDDTATDINSLKIIRGMQNHLPSLVLHAEDDDTVNVTQGVRIFHALSQKSNTSIFIKVPRKLKLGHQYVIDMPHLNEKFDDFLEQNKHIG